MTREHPDPQVQSALLRLTDALCSWERATGRTSVLVLREQAGFVYRAASGKPITRNDDVPDQQLVTVEAPDTIRLVPVASFAHEKEPTS